MGIVRERFSEETNRELLLVGDTVKMLDSPLDRIKRGATGRIRSVHGDLANDPKVLVSVEFKVGGSPMILCTGADRFRFTKHAAVELPDAENTTPNLEDEAE